MACSISSFSSLNQGFCKNNKLFQCPKVRSQGFMDNGKQGSIVDANMSVLRERIEQVRKMEDIRLTHICGWNYERNYESKHKGDLILSQSTNIMGLVSSLISLVFLTGSLSIFLVSLLVYIFI